MRECVNTDGGQQHGEGNRHIPGFMEESTVIFHEPLAPHGAGVAYNFRPSTSQEQPAEETFFCLGEKRWFGV